MQIVMENHIGIRRIKKRRADQRYSTESSNQSSDAFDITIRILGLVTLVVFLIVSVKREFFDSDSFVPVNSSGNYLKSDSLTRKIKNYKRRSHRPLVNIKNYFEDISTGDRYEIDYIVRDGKLKMSLLGDKSYCIFRGDYVMTKDEIKVFTIQNNFADHYNGDPYCDKFGSLRLLEEYDKTTLRLFTFKDSIFLGEGIIYHN